MPRVTKGNVREMFARTIERFQAVTGEPIGVVYCWRGSISVLGNETFGKYVSNNRENIWRALAYTSQTKDSIQIPERDLEMMDLFENLEAHNVHTLRKMVHGLHKNYG